MLADHGLNQALSPAADWAEAQAGPIGSDPARACPAGRARLRRRHLAVISETDILGDRLARPRKKRRAANFLAEASSPEPRRSGGPYRPRHRPL
jgi:transcription-repair coupling factor (superfamily II helicase)